MIYYKHDTSVFVVCCYMFGYNELSSGITSLPNPITGQDRPWGFQEVEAPQISRQLAHEGGKVVSPAHWLPGITLQNINI